nr:MAG TPA: hypothetical protein [Caudoviricetes sp.]
MPVSQEECRLLAAFGKLDNEKRKIVLAFARLLANGLEPNVTCGACEEHEEIPGKLNEIYCRMFDTIRKRSDFCNVSLRGGRDA